MKPTLSQMNKWFEEFNLVVFDGKLPKVPIKFNNTYRQLGQFYWGPTRGIGIKISLFYDRTEEQYRNCLLHEMCHLYCYKHGWYNEGHGSRWKAIADKAYRITGLHIQRCEQAGAFKPSACNQAKADAVQAKKTAPAIIVDIEYDTYHFLVKMTKMCCAITPIPTGISRFQAEMPKSAFTSATMSGFSGGSQAVPCIGAIGTT